MKTIFTAAAILCTTATLFATPVSAQDPAAPAGLYVEDDNHSYIVTSYDHQGYARPYLRWGDFDVKLTYDPENVTASTVEVVVQTASVDTGVERLDTHIASADMFDAETYPEATFVSTGLTQTSDTTGTMTGDITIKGITKPLTLDVTLNKIGETRGGGTKMGFSAKGTMLRSDFGVDFAAPFVSDEVELIIEVELVKAEE